MTQRTTRAIALSSDQDAKTYISTIEDNGITYTGGYGVLCDMGADIWGNMYQGQGKHIEVNYQRKDGKTTITAFETTIAA